MDFNLPPEIDSRTLSEKGVACKIISPRTGLPLKNRDVAVEIVTYGPDSKAYRDAEREVVKHRMAALARHEEFDEDKAAIEVLARITISWAGIFNAKGDVIAPAVETAVKLYDAFPIIRDQVANHVGSRRAFIGASPVV